MTDHQVSGSSANSHRLHLGIAEGGKLLALKRQHKAALERYREAMRLARSVRAPDIFGRHYLHCILESLEKSGAHDQVIQIAQGAADAVASAGDTPFHRRDRAALLERVGVAQIKAGNRDDACLAFQEAIKLGGPTGQPFAAQMLDWLARGWSINEARLSDAQNRHKYWVVRPDTVDATRAINPPDMKTTASKEANYVR